MKDALKVTGWTRIGNGLGVASGIWTFYNGYKKKDLILEAGGVASTLGYGLRVIAVELEIAGAETGALPLLLIGAALEVWAALNPPAADDCVKDQAMDMVNGVAKAIGEWYARRYGGVPWRAVDSPGFESALAEVKAAASACSGTSWTDYLPYDKDDRTNEITRFGEIGFKDDEAKKLVPEENWVKYLGRGSRPDRLSAPSWPPTWPKLEDTL
jgi:hypothetical protein